jgi:preprotein translocase subunit YajC
MKLIATGYIPNFKLEKPIITENFFVDTDGRFECESVDIISKHSFDNNVNTGGQHPFRNVPKDKLFDDLDFVVERIRLSDEFSFKKPRYIRNTKQDITSFRIGDIVTPSYGGISGIITAINVDTGMLSTNQGTFRTIYYKNVQELIPSIWEEYSSNSKKQSGK